MNAKQTSILCAAGLLTGLAVTTILTISGEAQADYRRISALTACHGLGDSDSARRITLVNGVFTSLYSPYYKRAANGTEITFGDDKYLRCEIPNDTQLRLSDIASVRLMGYKSSGHNTISRAKACTNSATGTFNCGAEVTATNGNFDATLSLPASFGIATNFPFLSFVGGNGDKLRGIRVAD